MNVAPDPSLLRAAASFRGRSFPRAKTRGSLLIVAMIISAVIGISLVSYIKLSTTSLTLADRSFYQTSAMNLTEMGIEEAMYCYNRLDDQPTPEAAWLPSGRTWTRASDNSVTTTISALPVGPGATGEVKIYCSNYNPGNTKPIVVAKAEVTFARGGPPIEKWLHVTLRKRSYWANGMVARNGIVWSGGDTEADSWNSDHDNNPATPGVAYGSTDGPARANATVGTPSSTNNAIDVGGGEVRGRLLTGGGTVDHSSGAVLSDDLVTTEWKDSLITNDFDANFPPITVPAPPTIDKNVMESSTTLPSELPRTGDKSWNGTYYYDFSWDYVMKMSGSDALTIKGPVTFLATAHNTKTVIDLSGNAQITVNPTGKLSVYTNGNIEATGNGFANSASLPSAFQILGTNPTAGSQTIRFTGNGAAIAAIYAPNATIELKGGAELHGAAVGNQITVNGTSKFHYDEALATTATGNPYGIEQWRELQSAEERRNFADQLNFN